MLDLAFRHTGVAFLLTCRRGMYGYMNTILNRSGEASNIMYTLMFGAGTAVLAYGCILRVFLRPMKVVSVRRKHCLVTGGSSGIGKELAKQMMREGAHVTIAARRQDVLDDAMEEILACRVSPDQMAQAVSMDVGNPKEVEQVVAKAVSAQGPVQILANCAGFAIAKEFDEMEASDLERLIRVNTLGTAYVTRALLPGMKAAGGGRILFTSSMCGLTGIYGYVGYCGSKFALVGMAQALQMEVKAYDIGVSVAYPPDTDTPGFATENVEKPAATHRISQSGGNPFSPSEVASKIVRGLGRGDFCITFGAEGYFLGLGTAGFSPSFSVLEAITQVLTASLLRAIFLLFTCDYYRIAAEERKKRTYFASPTSGNPSYQQSATR